jgi:hypothetical protein
MAPNNPEAGESAGFPSVHQQADPGSPDGCGAPPAEPGSEQGAPPSNTAPDNSKENVPSGFRLLRLAVDSLYLSFPGDLTPEVLAVVQKLKTLAQSEHPDHQAQAQYPLGSHIFEVKDKGARLFPFVLEDNAYRIQLSKPGKRLPMAYVKVSAEYLAHKGPVEVGIELQALLAEFGQLSGSNVVSRIDLAADFGSPVVMDSWLRSAWVTRATEIHSYAKDQRFTGWTIGMGGAIACRLYDKVQEICHSGKAWAMNQWLPMGWTPGEPVWRLEFEFKRDFLKERGLSSLDSVLGNLNGLWSYATTEWLRLTEPNEADATRSRWPTHPLWIDLASLDWESAQSVRLDKCSNARNPTELRLVTLVLGSLTSFMAMHNIADRNEGIDALLHKLYEHYSTVASRNGLTFDEYLAKRQALKAREFNTVINAPGKVDNLKDDYRREQEDNPYRRASRGE